MQNPIEFRGFPQSDEVTWQVSTFPDLHLQEMGQFDVGIVKTHCVRKNANNKILLFVVYKCFLSDSIFEFIRVNQYSLTLS